MLSCHESFVDSLLSQLVFPLSLVNEGVLPLLKFQIVGHSTVKMTLPELGLGMLSLLGFVTFVVICMFVTVVHVPRGELTRDYVHSVFRVLS